MPPTTIKVLERLALMGPNIYAHQPCIKWKIDLGPLEETPSDKIPDFPRRLKEMLPSLIEHRCSEGVRGGFFARLDDGTWLGHVMEHIALALQELVGVDVGFGKTRGAGQPGVYNVVYACEDRETGIMAGEIALELIEALVAQEPYALDKRIAELRDVNDRNALGPSTRAIVEAAKKRGIPHMRINEGSFVQLGYGARAKRIQATIASTTSHIGVDIAGDKDLTKSLLEFHGVPVPRGNTCRTVECALDIANDIGWPVVVKPLDASQGRGISTNIGNESELRIAFDEAQKFRSSVVIERFIQGNDYRLLVINKKFVAAAHRVPAHVRGDGRRTIRELVDEVNRDPRRGESHEKVLTKIMIDCMTEHLLGRRGMTPDSIPKQGEVVYLKTTANLSTGGTAIDITDRVHPANIELAERIALLVDLDIAGIDVVAPAIDTPFNTNGGGIVEVNAAPGLRMHLAPTEGKPRAVGEAIVDMLFPPGCESRIPIITVTGTNGKTTTARLCAHIAKQAGRSVGLTTTEGIYVRDRLVQHGDTTGPASAAVVLRDPSVDFAVLETARGGILRAGVGYDWSNAAIVTNIAEDHLGHRDVDTVEDLANVKAVTVERVMQDGYAILNAEDEMTPLIRQHANCSIALFALDPDNAVFREHVQADGLGATIEDGWFVLYENAMRIPLCEVVRVPVTFGGKANFNIANALAAVVATYATKVPVFDITAGLLSFFQSPFTTPGRMNFIDAGETRVLLDYAHNPAAIAAMCDLARQSTNGRLIGVIGLPGDRRDRDLRASVKPIAAAFDEVIIREDEDLRGRRPGETASLIHAALREFGFPEEKIVERHDEREALRLALRGATRADLVVFICDKAETALEMIEELRGHHGGASFREVADAAD